MSNAGRVTDAEITPPDIYFNRRAFLRAGVAAASVLATGYVYRKINKVSSGGAQTAALAGLSTTQPTGAGFVVEGEATTSLQDITHYNNFYEFTTDKESVAEASAKFTTAGWRIAVDGLCAKPREFDLDDLARVSAPEQRVYRMRCVEAWSMVIPWAGFSLSKLLEKVEPRSDAKYVAFTTLMDPTRFPGQRSQTLNWPYVEGLRMDEAMHPLAILATGLYGKALPPQDGAPVRLVVPWKYGFKGIKSIVKISLVADLPRTTWAETNPAEYGFYANVNPQHDHPRWSQASERRIGEGARRSTLMFNGYADEVGSLYSGMDLHKFF